MAAWNYLWTHLAESVALATLRHVDETTRDELADLRQAWSDQPAALPWLDKLEAALSLSAAAARELDERLIRFALRLESLATEMDFGFLYNPQRRLFSIGFNVEDGKLDRSHYDLLAPRPVWPATWRSPRAMWITALVPPGPAAHAGRGRCGPALVGRHDV